MPFPSFCVLKILECQVIPPLYNAIRHSTGTPHTSQWPVPVHILEAADSSSVVWFNFVMYGVENKVAF